MSFNNQQLVKLLASINLGSSVAEQDSILEAARIETSAFADLLRDRIDLIPGTKGSGKSALYRIFIEFLPDYLLKQRKAVVAHGVNRPGDNVFHVFNDSFNKLSEEDFVNFWCIYIVSLAHEQFLKNSRYADYLASCKKEINAFRQTSAAAGMPEIQAPKSLKDVLAWTLSVLRTISPKLKYKPPSGDEYELTLFNLKDTEASKTSREDSALPLYVDKLRENLEAILEKSDLNIWFMIDKLDEIFPRRSKVERLALRGLLRAMRIFTSPRIRVKVFLRDDMLNEVVSGGDGFVALTHLTARKADTLRWSEEQIISMAAKRFFSNEQLVRELGVDRDKLEASLDYRRESLNMILPRQVHAGEKQSPTIRWIYHHTADARNVVTPRDVIDLLTYAIRYQTDQASGNPVGSSDTILSPQAMIYGLEELSRHKRVTYLEAEFPHLWPVIKKFIGGKAEYSTDALRELFGKDWISKTSDLISIGFLGKIEKRGGDMFSIPFVYRTGLEVTQGRAT